MVPSAPPDYWRGGQQAAKGIRNLAPDIPWHKIIGMRNILVHGYFEIDLDVVWDAVQQDVPLLKPAVEALLKNLEDQSYGG